MKLPAWLGAAQWLPHYNRETAARDSVAAVIVTIMLIPQSLAYAMLAGLPPEVGLYASILPLVVYALLGSSRTLAVGPVAVASLMTVAAASQVATAGSQQYLAATIILAFLSGTILLVMALLRLGWIANLLSHPVVSGFISASGLLIAASQLKHLLRIDASGEELVTLAQTLAQQLPQTHWLTLAISLIAIACLLIPKYLATPLKATRLPGWLVAFISKCGPILAVLVTPLLTVTLSLDSRGLAVVGAIPAGLPEFTLPGLGREHWQSLITPAALLALIGFVESISLAQALAAKRRQRVDANRELMGLGLANIGSGLSGAFAVTGSFSRTTVNYDAGARTPMAGLLTGIGIALVALFFTGWFQYLPLASLAAIIVVGILPLINLSELKHLWAFSRPDALAMAATLAGVLLINVQSGLLLGVVLSVALFLWRTSQPHVAELGRIPGTHHFRNMDRHSVELTEEVLSIRVDESLYFGNARTLEDRIYDEAQAHPQIQHVVLHCSGINHLDASAMESLESLNERLKNAGVTLNLSNVKGPVMDVLVKTDFPKVLTGRVYLSHYQAMEVLAPDSLQEQDPDA